MFFHSRILTPPCGDWGPWESPLGGAGPNSNRFTKLSYCGGGLLDWTSKTPSKPEGLAGPARSAGLLTDVSYTKSRQEANLDSRFPTFLRSSPTMFSADIRADVVKGVPVKPSPLRMLEAGGVANELIGLEGVAGRDEILAEGHRRSARSVSFPKLLDGRLSLCRTANSWRRSLASSLSL